MADTPPIHRRDFLRAAGATAALAAASTVPTVAATPAGTAKRCIFLMLTGGPSQLDTWDPKPNAPSDVRGPFSPIRTAVPGLHLSELFPRMAAVADKFSLIRTMNHGYAPIHENGFQLLNTGRRFGDGPEWPSIGAVLKHLSGEPEMGDSWWVLPNAEITTGVAVSHGQGGGFLVASEHAQCGLPTNPRGERPSHHRFPMMTELAAAAALQGSRFITVNAYPTVFDSVSWDCHADKGSLRTTLADYRNEVAPEFDTAFTFLLTRLEEVGQLDETLVVAVGEFGRTPKLNGTGGRDHWANCWTAIVAGGGVQGGRVVGESDAIGGEPKERPVHCSELVATIYHALGIPAGTTIPGPAGSPVRVVDAEPVRELF